MCGLRGDGSKCFRENFDWAEGLAGPMRLHSLNFMKGQALALLGVSRLLCRLKQQFIRRSYLGEGFTSESHRDFDCCFETANMRCELWTLNA